MPSAIVAIAMNAESRRSQKHANRVPQVEEQILDEGEALLGVMVFPDRFGRAELECGLPPRLGGRHTGAQILLGLEREMFGDLFLQALVGTAARWRNSTGV